MILARLIRLRRKLRSTGRKASENGLPEMPGFDRAFYLARNPDVLAEGMDPLKHYLEHGWREGRDPSAGFSGRRYLALNPDVMAADMNPLVHYLKYGLAEGRPGAQAASDAPGIASMGEVDATGDSNWIGSPDEATRLL